MDTGKILIGFAFIILSLALTVSPSNALPCGEDCTAAPALMPAAYPSGNIAQEMPVLPATLTASDMREFSDQVYLP